MVPSNVLRPSSRFETCKWTFEKLREEVSKFEFIGDFIKNRAGAYGAILKRGLLEELCGHMKRKKRSWTNEEIILAAKKFSTRILFQKGNNNAYDLAHKRGILEESCLHMKATTRISCMEKDLMKEISVFFPEAITLHDHRVNIKNKDHIKRFELDIFVRNKMKGIEFDGTYHHSFEGLKRGRKHWPDEDIRDYHKIKDSWFASKGIRILHIKEKDWIADKEACIKKCLKFLGKPTLG